ARAHFDKYDCILLARNNIDFASAHSIIAFEDAVLVLLEKVCGGIFTGLAKVKPLNQVFFHLVPAGVSSSTIPWVNSFCRMSSAVLKSFFRRAALRFSIQSSISEEMESSGKSAIPKMR